MAVSPPRYDRRGVRWYRKVMERSPSFNFNYNVNSARRTTFAGRSQLRLQPTHIGATVLAIERHDFECCLTVALDGFLCCVRLGAVVDGRGQQIARLLGIFFWTPRD
eukprot:scaffold12269_cov41-Cyclotella_meneghiniana.AAC.6